MRGFAVSQSAALRSTSLTTAPAFLIASSSSLIFAISFSLLFSQAVSRSGARTAAMRARFFKVGLLVDPRFGAGDSPYDSRGRSTRDPYNFRRGPCQAG